MSEETNDPKTITVHNNISLHYRQLHVDGAYGGVTPRGYVNLSFFAERAPIPKATEHKLTEEGFLGSVIKHSPESKEGVLREFEFGVYMNIEVAKALVVLINTKVSEFEKLNNQK